MFDLYVLGAGFSSVSGAPKAKDLLDSIFHTSTDKNRAKTDKSLYNTIEKLLFPQSPQWVKEASFGEILSRLDLIRFYKPYSNLDYELVERVEDQLLKKLVTLLSPEKTKENRALYTAFLKTAPAGVAFITFNYDLLMELSFAKLKRNINYHLPVRSLEKPGYYEPSSTNLQTNTSENGGSNTDEDATSTDEDATSLFKLHGSIDLLFCSQCKNIFRNHLHGCSELICPLCYKAAPLRHFLVAPTLYKSYELPAIRDLWFEALNSLVKSKRLCFIGYSLPEGDILAYQLFDTAYRLAKKNQTVYLVNGPHYKPEKFEAIYGSSLKNTGLYFQQLIT